jgi:hypothetical protein
MRPTFKRNASQPLQLLKQTFYLSRPPILESRLHLARFGDVYFCSVWFYIWTHSGHNRNAMGLWRLSDGGDEGKVRHVTQTAFFTLALLAPQKPQAHSCVVWQRESKQSRERLTDFFSFSLAFAASLSSQLPQIEINDFCVVRRGNARSLWMGVLWALTSGSGVAVALLQGSAGPLIGVAISASLLPPVVNCVSYA